MTIASALAILTYATALFVVINALQCKTQNHRHNGNVVVALTVCQQPVLAARLRSR